MNRVLALEAALCAALVFLNSGCGRTVNAQQNVEAATNPVPTEVVPDLDPNNFHVDRPERFALATAGEHISAPELNTTGVVNPDVSRQVPVPSLASGKIVEIDARLGDTVQNGQLLFKVQSTDVAGAYSDYRKAIKNEQLTKIQLDRALVLFEHGAIPKSQVEIAQNAEDNAVVDVQTTTEHLKLLGSDPEHPSGIVPVFAPVSGVLTDQQITIASAVQAMTPPNPFTISDISHVWIICDVYENDMGKVQIGEYADVHLAAYPDRVLKARINNILPTLDPTIRTTKVRLEVENPGLMRLGMFVTATFQGQSSVKHATIPATAVLHLHDREWVYTPLGNGNFRRAEVVAGDMLPGNMQEVTSGLNPGEQVIANALVFQNTVEQ